MFSYELRPYLTRALAAMALVLLATHPIAPAQSPGQPTAAPAGARGPAAPEVPSITEDQLKQQLAGKTFFLRGGYLENDLHFDARGHFMGNAPRASYTLSLVEIDKVHLNKHRVELEGVRYGLHFLDAPPGVQDPIQASDKVRITPKKKVLKITIDRAVVAKKKSKPSKAGKSLPPPAAAPAPDSTLPSFAEASLTQAQANQMLRDALEGVFSKGTDDRLIASLPDFWQLYYRAVASRTPLRPTDPSVLRQSDVDQKARLISNFEPPSNDFAQAAGVAGMAQYRVVVEPDGKPGEIAVERPIGFGLDENAVVSIRKAQFQPAMKGGQPVAVVLDLVVEFRIYSGRTGAASPEPAAQVTEVPSLPGPYTANEPPAKQQ